MRKYMIPFVAFWAVMANASVYADDYKDYAKKVRNAVWNWDIDSFNEYTVPDKYSGESAVVIARHQRIEAFGNVKMGMDVFMNYTNTDRIMIKLNDKGALDRFSGLSFQEEAKSPGFFFSYKSKTIMGARIIKPDGSIREIDVDADAVGITEGKDEKEIFKKLALKDLEAGDILDYFYSEEVKEEGVNLYPHTFAFFFEYPTLSYSVECILGKKMTATYRSLNGAPAFEESEEGEKLKLSAERKDLPVIEGDMEEVRWLSYYRSLPVIRLSIINSAKRSYRYNAFRKEGLYKDVGYEEILQNKQALFLTDAYWPSWMKIYKKTKKALENYQENTPEATPDDIAFYIYDALRFYWLASYVNEPASNFCYILEKLLRENHIECKLGFTTNRYGAGRNEITGAEDLTVFVSANENKHLFFYPNGYRYAGEVDSGFEGETASMVAVNKYKFSHPRHIKGKPSEFIIPESSVEENARKAHIAVAFQEENPLELKINRVTTFSGEEKGHGQSLFVLFEDWDKLMRKRLLIETDFWQDLENDKRERRYADQYQTLFESRKENQQRMMQSEMEEYHGTNSGELIRYAVSSLGATREEPFFEFETEYTMDGLVKKAGDDLLLEAGKLIGTQWIPTPKEREREWDAYIQSPLLIENEIVITLPEHYQAEGIENLNKSIENEFGLFRSQATLDGNRLIIATTKTYKKNFVSGNDWSVLLEMVDKTNEFYAQSVILKRLPDHSNPVAFSGR